LRCARENNRGMKNSDTKTQIGNSVNGYLLAVRAGGFDPALVLFSEEVWFLSQSGT
jgi:hypothetical protein